MSTEPDVSAYLPPDDIDHTLNDDWEKGPVALNDTSEGMNYQNWQLTYDPSTPPGYNPDMMSYDGATGYYNLVNSYNTIGAANKITAVLRFKIPSFSGGGLSYMLYDIPSTGRLEIVCWASDFSDADKADTVSVIVRNSANAIIAFLFSPVGFLDDTTHVMFFEFDGDAGTSQFIIDSVDVDDLGNADRIAPTTGTLITNAVGDISVGSTPAGNNFVAGNIGYVGISYIAGLNWADFMDGSEPKELDEVTWTEWGGQPEFWNEDGEMDVNLGSAGNMTKNGTVFKVNVGNYQYFALTPDDTGIPITVLSGVNSVQCSFAFDQNGQPAIAWIDGSDGGHLWWFDIQTGQPEVFDFQNPVTSVALCLDDKRSREVGINDILLFYTIPAAGPDHYSLHNREQRDRFLTDYPMADPVWPYIHKLGMNSELRVQITTSTEPPA